MATMTENSIESHVLLVNEDLITGHTVGINKDPHRDQT